MAFKRFQKGSGGQIPSRPEGPSAAAIVAEQKVTAIAIFLGAVASIGGFMFGYVR
jgi:SP family sugar:H+ symporter-like MFS transporter